MKARQKGKMNHSFKFRFKDEWIEHRLDQLLKEDGIRRMNAYWKVNEVLWSEQLAEDEVDK